MHYTDSNFKSLQHALRIEICGGIASGKTTFAILLNSLGIETSLEKFQANPFWEAFYCNPILHALETEITFLLQHYHQIKVNSTSSKAFVCDFSLLLDLAYANVTLSNSKLETFLAVYNEVIRELPPPTLLIYLNCGPATDLERIRERARAVENSITLEYLSALNSSLERCVSEASEKMNILEINSEQQDFTNNKQVQKELVNLVQQALFS